MAITLKRQLDDAEKQLILQRHGRVCFARGHVIPENEPVHFDHIRAYALNGESELNNIAPMCEDHNKKKGTLPLEDFRTSLRLKEFFSQGDGLTLKHLLAFLTKQKEVESFGKSVSVVFEDGEIILDSASGKFRYDLHKCPITGWQYFYGTLPIELLNSDDEDEEKVGLQPRYLIYDKVFDLYRHFQRHPVLQPSIGRIHDNRLVLFDGQHKIAALLLNGRRKFECKFYVDPSLKLLNETNIAAHDNFSQTRFYASIMVSKLGTEFGADFEKYKASEDGATKSEAGFMKFLDRDPAQLQTRAERNKRFRAYLVNSALQSPDNRLATFVSKGNRSTDEKPLTIDLLTKSVFNCFLFMEPSEDNILTDSYKRDKEIENVVILMNFLHDLGLCNWNAKAPKSDGTQRKLARIFSSKSMMAWCEILRDAVCARLEIYGEEERHKPFYRDLTQGDLDRIKLIVERLFAFKLWLAPPDSDIDHALAGNKSVLKEWFKSKGLDVGYLMGVSQ